MYRRALLVFCLAAGMLTIGQVSASAAGPAAPGDTVCTGVLEGTYSKVVVPNQAACTLTGATVTGSVVVRRNAYLQMDRTTIGGNIAADRARTVFLDASTVGGNIITGSKQLFVYNSTINGKQGIVSNDSATTQICGNDLTVGGITIHGVTFGILVGSVDDPDCLGNTIEAASVEVTHNDPVGYLFVMANAVPNGNMEVGENDGAAPKEVEGNTGGFTLECDFNEEPFEADFNTGWRDLLGQCGEEEEEEG